jgi:hypothetical protein
MRVKDRKKPRLKRFRSTHDLQFMACPWHRSPEFIAYKIGTCSGIYSSTPVTYDIVAVVNDEPGNGHFEDVLEWFEQSCRRDRRDLRFMEILNEQLREHLVNKRGFTHEGKNNLIKRFVNPKF